MDVLHCNVVHQAINIMDGLIPPMEEAMLPVEHLKKLIVFALMWSCGASIELDDRAKVDAFS